MIFISCPYSHDDPKVVNDRYCKLLEFINVNVSNGVSVISPVVMGHSVVEHCGVPSNWEYWEDSVGVKGEMEYAKEINIPTVFFEDNQLNSIYIHEKIREMGNSN
jgi:hypothetical protein